MRSKLDRQHLHTAVQRYPRSHYFLADEGVKEKKNRKKSVHVSTPGECAASSPACFNLRDALFIFEMNKRLLLWERDGNKRERKYLRRDFIDPFSFSAPFTMGSLQTARGTATAGRCRVSRGGCGNATAHSGYSCRLNRFFQFELSSRSLLLPRSAVFVQLGCVIDSLERRAGAGSYIARDSDSALSALETQVPYSLTLPNAVPCRLTIISVGHHPTVNSVRHPLSYTSPRESFC